MVAVGRGQFTGFSRPWATWRPRSSRGTGRLHPAAETEITLGKGGRRVDRDESDEPVPEPVASRPHVAPGALASQHQAAMKLVVLGAEKLGAASPPAAASLYQICAWLWPDADVAIAVLAQPLGPVMLIVPAFPAQTHATKRFEAARV